MEETISKNVVHRGKIEESVELPEKLVEKLRENYTGLELDDANIAANCLYFKYRDENILYSKYIGLNADYIKKVLPDPRNKIWRQMVKDDIFQVFEYADGTRYKTNKECKKYRINPDLLSDNLQEVYIWKSYINKKLELNSLKAIEKLKLIMPDKYTIEQFVDDSFEEIKNDVKLELKINYKNHTLRYDKKTVFKPGKTKPTDEEFEEIIEEKKCELAHTKAQFYKQNLKKLYSTKIDLPHRNRTNKRMDHLITSFPSRYLKFCKLDGEDIMEIDMRNAQFTLFSNLIDNPNISILSKYMLYYYSNRSKIVNLSSPIVSPILLFMGMRDKPDVKIFINACKQGNLYEIIMRKLHLCDRDQLKKMFMGFFFSKIQYEDTSYSFKTFKNVFPNIVQLVELLKLHYIAVYKTSDDKNLRTLRYTSKKEKTEFEAGNDYLPIGLQRCESEIFIDNILPELQKQGLTVISKHDAILCKKSEQGKVLEVMTDILNRILGANNFSLKVKAITQIPELITA